MFVGGNTYTFLGSFSKQNGCPLRAIPFFHENGVGSLPTELANSRTTELPKYRPNPRQERSRIAGTTVETKFPGAVHFVKPILL